MPPVFYGDHADQTASGAFHPDPSIFFFKSSVYDSTVRTISFKYLPTYIHLLTCILLNDLCFPTLCIPNSNQPTKAVRISWTLYLFIPFYGLFRFFLRTEQPVLFEPDDSLVVCEQQGVEPMILIKNPDRADPSAVCNDECFGAWCKKLHVLCLPPPLYKQQFKKPFMSFLFHRLVFNSDLMF